MTSVQQTLAIVKPNATAKSLVGQIIAMFEEGGLRVRALRMLRLSRSQAEAFYAVHRERPFFGSLVEFMCSGPVVPMVLEGDNAVARCREIMGATDPAKAAVGTIRKRFGESIQDNAVHGSDSPENGAIEIAFFFPGADLVAL